jgi:ligand-binding sensor domain-containing protein
MMEKILRISLSLLFPVLFLFSQTLSQQNSWQFTSGPYYGAATTMACNASGHVFAGTVTGVFRSTDNGDTWTWVTQSMGALGVSTLMIKSDGKVFAGLSNGNILCSNTNGNSWNAAGSGLPGLAITDLKQKGTDTILASTLGGGIYCSMNNGASWGALNQGLENLQVQSIAFKSDGNIFAGTTNGLWYSSDNGSHWDTLPGSGAGDVRKIVIDQSDNIYAINFPSFSSVDTEPFRIPKIFKSTNNGTTWSNHSIDSIYYPAIWGIDRFGNPVLLVPEFWSIRSRFESPTFIAIDQNGDLYANSNVSSLYGSQPVLRHSTNNGSTWDTVLYSGGRGFAGTSGVLLYSQNSDSLLVGSITSICFSPNNYIYLGSTLGGIIRMPSSAMSLWKKVNTKLVSRQVYSQVKKSNGKMFAMTDWGLFRSSSAVDAWELIDQNYININPTTLALNSAEDLFVAHGYIYRSSDEGNAWNIDTCGMSSIGPFAFQGIGAASNGTLYTGSYQFNNFYRSIDNGVSWQKSDQSVACTTFVAGASGNMYGLDPPYFFKSTDNGNTWTSKLYYTGCVDTTQYMHGGSPEFVSVFEVNNYTYLVGTTDGVFKSIDTGNTWQNSSQGLPYIGKMLLTDYTKSSLISTLLGFPTVPAIVGNVQGRIFIGCNYGVFSSIDTGKTWQPYNEGLPSGVAVNSLLIDNNGYLYAGTASGVVFKTEQTTVGVAETKKNLPLAWRLDQNYPNPFNPTTQINYQLSKISKVSLKVYDLLGREVANLVNEEQSAGPHTIKWNASEVATGVYFYQLTAGSFVQTKKMLLLK